MFAFEKAENETNPVEHDRLMTIVVVGGGPTGVELAGSFAELTRKVLNLDFRRIDPTQSHVMLLEGGPRILSHLPPDLSEKAKWQLIHLGVNVKTDTQVKSIREGVVELANGNLINAGNIVWAAGVASTPLTKKLGCELDRGGRVKVNPDLSVPGHPEIFAIGDMALVLNADGKPVPGVSPAAMQMGRHVAKIIKDELNVSMRRPDRRGVQILGQRHDGNHRPFRRRRADRQTQVDRLSGMAGVAVRASDFPHRLSEPDRRAVPMGVFLFFQPPQRPHHHPPAARSGRRLTAARHTWKLI